MTGDPEFYFFIFIFSVLFGKCREERKSMIKGQVEALNLEHMGHYRKRQLEPQRSVRTVKGKSDGISRVAPDSRGP